MISKYFTSAASGRIKSSACCKDTCKLCFPWRLSLSFCSLTNSSETCSLDCVRTAYNAKKSKNSHSESCSDLFCPIYYHYFQKSGELILFVKKGNKTMLWINTTSSLLPGQCTRNKGKVNFKSPGREEEASDKYSFVQSPTFLLCLSMSWLYSWRARRVGNHRCFQELAGMFINSAGKGRLSKNLKHSPWNFPQWVSASHCPTRRAPEQLIPWKEKGWRGHGFACITKEKKSMQSCKRSGNGERGLEQWQELCYRGSRRADSDQHIF